MPPDLPPFQRLILDAWQRLKPQLLANSAELAQRLARRLGKTFSRPPRAWCLAVRATDRRINALNARIDPDYATDPRDPAHPGRVVQHTVTLTATLLRELCCPVQLDPPGELWDDAAKKLGTTKGGLTNKRISGALQTRHIKGLLGRRGRPVPILFTPKLLDPGSARDFATPHPLWIGNEFVSARIPNDLRQTLVRVPAYLPPTHQHKYDAPTHPEVAGPPPRRPRRQLPPPAPDYVWYKWSKSGEYLGEDPTYWRKNSSDPGIPPPRGIAPKRKRKRAYKPSRATGSLVFRGWRWLCPRCNRLVRMMYLPLPPAELPAAGGSPQPSSGSSLTPGPLPLTPPSFACAKCHRIRGFSAIAANSWNDLVSYFSGGLLYGHEVPEPPGYRASAVRKNHYTPQINRPSPRREKLLELLLAAMPPHQIASRLHLKPGDVFSRITTLLKKENVPDRPALATKYNRDPTTQPSRLHQVRLRRNKVLELLRQGLPASEIAKQLGVKPKIIWNDTYYLRQRSCDARAVIVASME